MIGFIKSKGSHLPTLGRTTNTTTLVIIKQGLMATYSSSSTERADALSTSNIVEDAGVRGGSRREHFNWWIGEVLVKVGETAEPMAGVESKDWIPIKIPVGTSIRNLDPQTPNRALLYISLSTNWILAIIKITDYLYP